MLASHLPCPATAVARRTRRARSAACDASSATVQPQTSLSYTPLEGNSFAFTLPASGTRILVDPWLFGPLSFGPPPLDALYSGQKPSGDLGLAVAEGADVLLLSQGLPDHAHVPTLERLSKSLPVVASPTAAAVARACGFTDVHSLAHGESVTVRGVTFRATAGALVGPPWSTRENGFLVYDATCSLYYEPHCDCEEKSVVGALESAGLSRGVDIAVLPCAAISLAGYPLVLGTPEKVLRLLGLLQPRTLIPLRNDIIQETGLIAGLVWTAPGAVTGVAAALARDAQLAGRVRLVEPGETGRAQAVQLR